MRPPRPTRNEGQLQEAISSPRSLSEMALLQNILAMFPILGLFILPVGLWRFFYGWSAEGRESPRCKSGLNVLMVALFLFAIPVGLRVHGFIEAPDSPTSGIIRK